MAPVAVWKYSAAIFGNTWYMTSRSWCGCSGGYLVPPVAGPPASLPVAVGRRRPLCRPPAVSRPSRFLCVIKRSGRRGTRTLDLIRVKAIQANPHLGEHRFTQFRA